METLRKTYVIQGETFICKVPDPSDLWAMDGKLPVLPKITPEDADRIAEELTATPQKKLAMLELSDRLLVLCGITPKFIAESPAEVPPGCIPVREISPFLRFELANALLEDSGFTRKAADTVRPTSATEAAS